MLELSLNNATKSGKATIPTAVYKLLVTQTLTGLSATSTDAEVIDAFFVANTDAKIQVTRQKGNSSTTILPNFSLAILAEIASQNEGFINITNVGTTWTIEFTVELSNFGAIDVKQNEYIILQATACGSATLSTDFRSLGHLAVTDAVLEYKSLSLLGASPSPFNIENAYAVVIPATTTEIELRGQGKTHKLESVELKKMANDQNEITYLINGRIVPQGHYQLIETSLVDEIQITLPTAGNFYMLVNKIV